MSGVDVLAVLDDVTSELIAAAKYWGEGSYWGGEGDQALLDRAAVARAAVADLIEACDSLSSDPHAEDWARLYSALARVRGTA